MQSPRPGSPVELRALVDALHDEVESLAERRLRAIEYARNAQVEIDRLRREAGRLAKRAARRPRLPFDTVGGAR